MLVKILASCFLFAEKQIRQPVVYATIALGVTLLSNLCLMRIWAHVGLAASVSLAAWVNAGLLVMGLRRWEAVSVAASAFMQHLYKLLLCSGLMALFLLWVVPNPSVW